MIYNALRQTFRRPGFVLLTVLILALGIGGSTAVFSVVRSLVLAPLPFEDPEGLVFVWEGGGKEKGELNPFSYPNFLDLRRSVSGLEEISVFINPTYSLTGEETSERVAGELVSGTYFEILRVAPKLGRPFGPDEESRDDAGVAIISHSLWQRRFGGEGATVGKDLEVNGEKLTVIGIMPDGFRGITGSAELWLPAGLHKLAVPELEKIDPMLERDRRWHAVIGRLAPGVTPERIGLELDAWSRQMTEAYPGANTNLAAQVVAMDEQLFGSFRAPLIVLQFAVFFVLLIACTNIANMQMVRAFERQRELAIRSALGATRSRLVGQLLVEAMLLAVLGGLAGIVLAVLLVQVLAASLADQMPSYLQIGTDGTVLVFAVLMAAVTGLVVGVLPAFRFSRPELVAWLKDSSQATTLGASGHRSRNLLVMVEIALAVVLLVSSILLIQSFEKMKSLDPGFAADQRVVGRLDLPARSYTEKEILALADDLQQTLGANAAIRSLALASDIPLGDRQTAAGMTIEGFTPPPPDDTVDVYLHVVTSALFPTLEIPLLSGRLFDTRDHLDSERVGVVSETMAKRFWPGEDPLGKRLRMGDLESEEPWISVIGVVGDVRYRDLLEEPDQSAPDLYLAFAQQPAVSFVMVAHTDLPAGSLAGEVRRMLRQRYPGIPVYNVSTLEAEIEDSTSSMQLASVLMGLFGIVALVLSGLGLYAVISYSVRQREREFGIRMAIGARASDVLWQVVRGGVILTLVGLLVGTVLAFLAAQVLASSFFGVSATDPVAWGIVLLLLLVTALLATAIPAWSASRYEPVEVLRE